MNNLQFVGAPVDGIADTVWLTHCCERYMSCTCALHIGTRNNGVTWQDSHKTNTTSQRLCVCPQYPDRGSVSALSIISPSRQIPTEYF
jgi:hypothetical protein